MNRWEDIIEIPLPLPFALKIIKAYLIEGKNGYTIIDTGLNSEEDRDTWNQAQDQWSWNWKDVEKIVLTHYHPDHYGLAGTLQQLTGAPVYISKKDTEQALFFFDRESKLPELMAKFNRKSLFERFYDAVGNFIGGGKSFAPNELKTFA